MKVAKRSKKLTMIKVFLGGMVKTKKTKKRARRNTPAGLTNFSTALLLLRVKKVIIIIITPRPAISCQRLRRNLATPSL